MAIGEWDQRQLCSDGACIGVIGPEGTCKVCGRAAPNWGDERNRGLIEPPDDDNDEDEDGDDEYEDDETGELCDDEEGVDDHDDDGEDHDDDQEQGGAQRHEPGIAAAPSGWSSRQLCSDGGCIGVIGPDSRCKVCGRASVATPVADSAAPAATDPDGSGAGVN